MYLRHQSVRNIGNSSVRRKDAAPAAIAQSLIAGAPPALSSLTASFAET